MSEDLIFGLYHVPFDAVKERMDNAHRCGIKHYDTAQLYGNERICAENCHPDDVITTKIYAANNANQVHKLVKRSIRRFGSKRINCMLLHRPMPNICWHALTQHIHQFDNIGISNYDLNGLKNLIEYCNETGIAHPSVHQIEVHPFVSCDPMIDFCHNNGIKVQGHTVLTRGKFLNYPPLLEIAKKNKITVAQVLVSWARHKNISICLGSSSFDHLTELTCLVKLSVEDISEMNTWHLKSPYRFYDKINKVPYSLNELNDQNNYINHVVTQLSKDMNADYPSDICEHLPLAGEAYRSVGREIANRLYPEISSDSSLNKYRTLVKSLKHKRMAHQKAAFMHKKGISCCVIRRTSGPYSDNIMDPKPMPVDITDPKEFVPFFEYLEKSETLPQGDTIFVRGSIFPDGRMDLCKQVVGPTSIAQLCKTVSNSRIVRHFLLGNNVALQSNQEEGATALASIMIDNSKPIETWYLAGNCIGANGIKIMAQALTTNTQCKALWLKRNPIGPFGATYLNAMLRVNETLVLLDLHNCALGDEGVNKLLANPFELKALKHLYLDANGIESTTSIANLCSMNRLVTLYLSINRLKDTAIEELAFALKGSTSLKRLCLASTHMHNDGLRSIVSMALTCPNLKCLNIGCYKSTADLGEHPGNFFDDDVIPDLTKLLSESSSLEYLNTAGSKISQEGLLLLPRPDKISLDLGKGPWHHVHEKDKLRFVKQPKRVVHIDSIYRGKM